MGRLASFANAATALFDPAVGTTGEWTAGPTPPSEAYGITAMVLIEGAPEQCAPSCGKVLAHFSRWGNTVEDFRSYWALYDPAGDDGVEGTEGKWTTIKDHTAPEVTPNYSAAATQITGSPEQCFPNCGKVFITGDVFVGDGNATLLFNPKATDPAVMFEQLETETNVEGRSVRLNDGRLLYISWQKTTLFDPTDKRFYDGANTPFPFGGLPDVPVLLPNGDVLVTYQEDSTAPNTGCLFGCNGEPGLAAVYTPPDQGPGGSWDPVDTCGPRCFVLAALPNGEVLAFSSERQAASGLRKPGHDFPVPPGRQEVAGRQQAEEQSERGVGHTAHRVHVRHQLQQGALRGQQLSRAVHPEPPAPALHTARLPHRPTHPLRSATQRGTRRKGSADPR